MYTIFDLNFCIVLWKIDISEYLTKNANEDQSKSASRSIGKCFNFRRNLLKKSKQSEGGFSFLF
jgi:hypothetical protein